MEGSWRMHDNKLIGLVRKKKENGKTRKDASKNHTYIKGESNDTLYELELLSTSQRR